jgi:anion-transporting  ArsA/GET3 family ATPase
MNQKIVFVTGKGGVGKSSVAAGFALSKARAGLSTLLVELGDQSHYEIFLKSGPISYLPLSLEKNLDVALWSSQSCLKEYAMHLLKIESLYRLFFENKISQTLINIAPALPELAVLGKVTSGPRRHGPASKYDLIVVDSPSTGHFLSLLRAPKGMAAAVQFGPMGEQSRSIIKTLLDPQVCEYLIVTLPEELPLQESLELYETLKSEFSLKPKLILNRYLQTSLKSENLSAEAEDFSKYFHVLLKRQEQIIQKLSELKIKPEIIPWIFGLDPLQFVEEVAEAFKGDH